MKKLLALVALVALNATGCTLYFGESDDDDVVVTNYCEPSPNGTVCYTCYEYEDGWAECFPDSYGCNSDNDCATGCYCEEGTGECAEAGWCASDSDCGGGLVCDCSGSCADPNLGARDCNSCQVNGCPVGFVCAANGDCVPDPNQPGCSSDAECAAGCYCAGGYCEESSICTSDSQCPSGQTCDEVRNTCVPGTPPPPPPSCGDLTSQAACDARTDCRSIIGGTNCHRPDGSTCQMNDTNCICEPPFTFQGCVPS